MNQKDQFIAAVDIGTTKIVTLVGKKNENGKLEIISLKRTDSKGVKRGVVLNIEETVNAISSTVSDVQIESGIIFNEVFVGIAGQHIKSIKNRGYILHDSYEHEIKQEDIDKLIDDMYKIPIDVGEEIIHVLPQTFVVDNETGVKNPIGMCGKKVEANFHIVIGQISSAKNIEKCVNRVGLKLIDLILEPLASSAAVLTDEEKEAGVALVDIGGGTTDIAIYYDNVVRHTAVIPFGGNVITNDIKEGCSILLKQAEDLKIKFGSAVGDIASDDKVVTIPGISGREPKEISFKSLAFIIQARMEEIIDHVLFEIENSGYRERLSAGIVITGGGALLENLSQLIKFQTGLDVRVGYPNEHLAPGFNKEINHPMYATSIGLIIKGFDYLEKYKEIFAEEKEDLVEVDEGTEKSKKLRVGIIESIKRSLIEIFEENDQKLQ